MDHDACVGHGGPLALGPCSEKEGAHGSCQAEAEGLHLRSAHLHAQPYLSNPGGIQG